MPWPKEHKRRTRDRIVQAAAAAFRAGGISGVRLEDVMARAGLTHGGFYAHFASKDDLLREALDHASGQTVAMLSTPLADAADDGRLQAVIEAYLSPGHAAHPEVGCPLAALGPEIARAGGTTQRSLAGGVKGRLAWMRGLLPEDRRRTVPEDQLIGTLACMVGGIILARAVGNKEAGDILDACRTFLSRASGDAGGRARGPRKQGSRTRSATKPAKKTSTGSSRRKSGAGQ